MPPREHSNEYQVVEPWYSRVHEGLLVAAQVLRSPLTTAQLVPTRKDVCQAIVGNISFDTKQRIVELGFGTAPITAALHERMRDHAAVDVQYFGVELNKTFHRFGSNRVPQADLILGNALDVRTFMEARGMEGIDHLLCGLPLPSFPQELRQKLLALLRPVLKGPMYQVTAFGKQYIPFYEDDFESVTYNPMPHFPYTLAALLRLRDPRQCGGYFKLEGIKDQPA